MENDISCMISGGFGGGASKDEESHARARLSSLRGCHVGLRVYRLKTPSLLTRVWNGWGRVSGGGVARGVGELERSSHSGGVGTRGGTCAKDISPWGT